MITEAGLKRIKDAAIAAFGGDPATGSIPVDRLEIEVVRIDLVGLRASATLQVHLLNGGERISTIGTFNTIEGDVVKLHGFKIEVPLHMSA